MKKLVLTVAALALLPSFAMADTYHHVTNERVVVREPEFMDFGSKYDNTNVGTELSGANVAKVQQILQNEGFYRYPVTGHWGRETVEAVLQFQRQNDLKATGHVGPKTAEKLNKFGGQYGIYINNLGQKHVKNETFKTYKKHK